MTKYLLSIYQPDGAPPPPEVLGPIMQRVADFNRALQEAGAFVFTDGLTPPASAAVLRARDGKVIATDGPFTESKEHVGGFWIIQAPTREAALEWGRKAALATTLPIEVRAFASSAG